MIFELRLSCSIDCAGISIPRRMIQLFRSLRRWWDRTNIGDGIDAAILAYAQRMRLIDSERNLLSREASVLEPANREESVAVSIKEALQWQVVWAVDATVDRGGLRTVSLPAHVITPKVFRLRYGNTTKRTRYSRETSNISVAGFDNS